MFHVHHECLKAHGRFYRDSGDRQVCNPAYQFGKCAKGKKSFPSLYLDNYFQVCEIENFRGDGESCIFSSAKSFGQSGQGFAALYHHVFTGSTLHFDDNFGQFHYCQPHGQFFIPVAKRKLSDKDHLALEERFNDMKNEATSCGWNNCTNSQLVLPNRTEGRERIVRKSTRELPALYFHHMAKHVKLKSIACPECDAEFRRPEQLKQHLHMSAHVSHRTERVNLRMAKKIHKCDSCDYVSYVSMDTAYRER